METPSPGFILSRAIMVLALIIAVLFGVRVYKNHQRKSAIVGEMTTLAGESSFFQQFYAEDARKALVRSVGLMLEAEKLGVAPDTLIDLAFGIKTGPFDSPP